MSDLKKWARENEDVLEMVAKHGRTKTIREQAKAIIEVTGIDIDLDESSAAKV